MLRIFGALPLALLVMLSLIWLMQSMIAAQPIEAPPPGSVRVVAVGWDDAEAPWPEPVTASTPEPGSEPVPEETSKGPEPRPDSLQKEIEPPPPAPAAKPAPPIQLKPKPRPKSPKKPVQKRKAIRQASQQGSAGQKPSQSRPIHRPRPAYPRGARRQHQEGYVVVGYNLDADGRTFQVRVLSASPPGVFNQAALSAVRRWRYTATGRTRHGMRTRIRFQLR